MLKRSYYYDPEHFLLEKEEIFENGWVFVCLNSELTSNNDFVTLDVFGTPLVIQNFRGELRAFLNICTHRFNKIQVEESGRRALTCMYHCWSFDKEGCPTFIPKKESFPELSDPDFLNENFSLKRFKLDICGDFVFVSLSDNIISLTDHLGSFYSKIEEISKFIGNKIHTGKITHKANWKLLVENVLECYHCSVVHKDTLYGKLGVGGIPIDSIEISGRHSSCHFPKVKREIDKKKSKILNFLESRPFKHDSFYHIYIFPNLVISSTEGSSFYVGQLQPIDSCNSELKVRFFEPLLDYSTVNSGIREVLADESVNFGYQILEEDKNILENIQRGISFAESGGIVSTEEVRIKYFMNSYLNAIERNG